MDPVLRFVGLGLVVDVGVRASVASPGSTAPSGSATAIGGADRAALTPAAIECQTCSGPSSSRKPERVSTSRTLPKTRTR